MDYASVEPLPENDYPRADWVDGNAESEDLRFVQAHPHQAVVTIQSRAVRLLEAEYALSTPLLRKSLLELQEAYRASQPCHPIPICLPPLMAPILQTLNISIDAVSYSLTERFIFGHLLISVESFLASLSLLDILWDITEHCPSIPALFCDSMMGHDPYRNRSETSIARVIMEHIDTHHSSISHEVNIELGSKHLGDPIPEVSDNQCQCPLQRLDMSNVSRNCPQAVVEAAYKRLIEVEEFATLQQLVDPLTVAKYFHLFEH